MARLENCPGFETFGRDVRTAREAMQMSRRILADMVHIARKIKSARKAAGLTQEALAEKAGITTRYIMAIENENRYPSMEVLFKLIRALKISADTIFYPEIKIVDSRAEKLVRLIYQCDKREIDVVWATVEALLERK